MKCREGLDPGDEPQPICRRDPGPRSRGVFNRIVAFDTRIARPIVQYAYRMAGSSMGRGISALVALNDHEFLVLERNNRGLGVDGTLGSGTADWNKKVFRISPTGATDVSNVDVDAPGAAFIKPLVGSGLSRIQCSIGTFANCNTVNPDGSVGAPLPQGSDFTGHALIPGVLQASTRPLRRTSRGSYGRAGRTGVRLVLAPPRRGRDSPARAHSG